MAQSVEGLAGGQPGAVEEEEQGHGPGGGALGDGGGPADGREEGGEAGGAEQGQDERVQGQLGGEVRAAHGRGAHLLSGASPLIVGGRRSSGNPHTALTAITARDNHS